MIQLKVIQKESYARARWKNGLGYTDQIAIFPENADLRRADFLWRLSSARIEQASAFSSFPEHDRVIVILKGQGLRLMHSFEEGGYQDSVDLPCFEPYEFPGDISSRCELIEGPVTDLSVFVRKAEVGAVTDVASVHPDEPYEWIPQGRWNFAFAAEGEFEIEAPGLGGRVELREGDTARVELDAPIDEGGLQIRALSGEGRVVLVSLQ